MTEDEKREMIQRNCPDAKEFLLKNSFENIDEYLEWRINSVERRIDHLEERERFLLNLFVKDKREKIAIIVSLIVLTASIVIPIIKSILNQMI